MRRYIEKACEEIDAAMFSGDSFDNAEERKSLQKYMDRWKEQMKFMDDLDKTVYRR